MSAKTKIIVLHMKEVIYTIIFVVLAILLAVLLFLMFGKESAGLPEALLYENGTHCVRIPMREHLRSLNLSNSVAIALYEVLRQQNFSGLCESGHLTHYNWNS